MLFEFDFTIVENLISFLSPISLFFYASLLILVISNNPSRTSDFLNPQISSIVCKSVLFGVHLQF